MRSITVDSRLLGAALLSAVAAAFVLVATRPAPTTAVLVTEVPAAAGTPVEALRLVERSVVDPTGLVPASRWEDVSGAVLAVDVGAGIPLIDSVLLPSGSSTPDVLGIEIPASAAVHGALAPGDRVDIHLVGAGGELLAGDVPVVAVISDDGTLGTGDVGVLLAMREGLAPLIVEALHGDGLHLVRSGR
jgi:Flp pilus assembly protein CpaB